jgi:hypothetical protein
MSAAPGMSEYLASFYGTNGTPKTASAEPDEDDLVKQAQVELFCKVAAEQNIDIASMPDQEVEQLFSNFVTNSKTAADKDEDEDKDDKKEKAEHELAEKKAAVEEFAKYDFFGRQMAHAYVDELKKIAAAQEGPGDEGEGEGEGEEGADEAKQAAASSVLKKLKGVAESAKGHLSGAAAKAKGHASSAAESVGDAFKAKQFRKGLEGHAAMKHKDFAPSVEHAVSKMRKADRPGAAAHLVKDTAKHVRKDLAVGGAKTLGAYGAAGGAAGGAGYLAGSHKKKESSAIDELAMEQAIYKAAAAGFDVDEAAERVAAALTLGIEDSAKIAAANDVDAAVDIRALEMLDAAGYPVTWNAA